MRVTSIAHLDGCLQGGEASNRVGRYVDRLTDDFVNEGLQLVCTCGPALSSGTLAMNSVFGERRRAVRERQINWGRWRVDTWNTCYSTFVR